jgi:hypothetical protein
MISILMVFALIRKLTYGRVKVTMEDVAVIIKFSTMSICWACNLVIEVDLCVHANCCSTC